MRQKVLLALRASISLVLIAALIYIMRDSIPNMVTVVKRLSPYVFFAAVLLFLCSTAIASFRLRILLVAQNIHMPITGIMKLTLVGYFFSSFLPTSVGGDVVKAYYIAKTSKKTLESYTSVFMDRFLGMCTIFLFAVVSFFLTREMHGFQLKWPLISLLAASALLLLFFLNKRLARALSSFAAPLIPEKLKKRLGKLYNTINSYKNHKRGIAKCLLLSLVGQLAAFSTAYIFALGLNSHVPLRFILLVMPMASIASMLPSIYGTGPREVAIVVMLSPLIGGDKALAISVLWFALLLISALLGAIIYTCTKQYKITPGETTAYDMR